MFARLNTGFQRFVRAKGDRWPFAQPNATGDRDFRNLWKGVIERARRESAILPKG
jgi:hypothetical protein